MIALTFYVYRILENILLLLSFHPVREKCTPFIHRWGDPFVSVPAGIHNPGTS